MKLKHVVLAAMMLLFSMSAFAAEETLSNTVGDCSDLGANYLGCSNSDGTSGNPNDFVECYSNATLSPPFELIAFTYTIGSVDPPDTLNLVVYEWSGSGAPGTIVTTIPLADSDRAAGFHDLQLATPVALPSANFCVGLSSAPTNDGFRILATESGSGVTSGTSWVQAPACGITSFTELTDAGFSSNWCVTATIRNSDTAAIPSLNEWGVIIFSLLLGSVAIWYMRKKVHGGSMA